MKVLAVILLSVVSCPFVVQAQAKPDPAPVMPDKEARAMLSLENQLLILQHQYDQAKQAENDAQAQAAQVQKQLADSAAKDDAAVDASKWKTCTMLLWNIYPGCSKQTDLQYLPAPAKPEPKPEPKK